MGVERGKTRWREWYEIGEVCMFFCKKTKKRAILCDGTVFFCGVECVFGVENGGEEMAVRRVENKRT